MPTTTGFSYNELIAEIQDVVEDSSAEFVAEMPTIVSIGESRLYADLDLELFDRVLTGVLTININEQAIKTATWQGTRSIHLTPVGGGDRVYLQRRTYEYCVDYQPDPAINRAQPIYYAEFSDTEFFMVPSPDVAYPFEMREISNDATLALAPGQQNTWLGDNMGDLLLYSCLIFSEPYLKADTVDMDKWKALYAETMPTRKERLKRQLRANYAPIRNAARTENPQQP